tara:strand:+ start:1383 stop:1739 length:357 start_codon:yes stop_codon:yes gene_type:complete
MVEVWDMVGLGSLILTIVLIWRIEIVKATIHDRVDEIDRSLGSVVGMIIDKIDGFSQKMPEISLINQNPIGQIIDFLKGNAPQESVINSQPKPRDSSGQFVEIEVEPHATKEKENVET